MGELDIVVSAQGKLAPQSFVRVTQTADGGVVSRILVKDGERVTEGQPLIELDATQVEQTRIGLEAEVSRLRGAAARISAETGVKPEAGGVLPADYLARKSAYEALQAEARKALDKANADLSTGQAELVRLKALLKHADAELARHKELQQSGFISAFAYQEKARDQVDTALRVEAQLRQLKTLEATVQQASAAVTRVDADYRKSLAVEQVDVHTQLSRAEAELVKAEHRQKMSIIKSPALGTVTGLQSLSAGQVVQPGSPLLSIVPDKEKLLAEVWVRNEDAGFIYPGLPVRIKLASFPFQKYGWLEGEVVWIGADSETPDSMRNVAGELLFYRARISLSTQALVKDGTTFEAKPGMQVIADFQLGKRTLFEYLTSPLKKTVLEAARER